MYRVMQSEKFTLKHLTSGPVSTYRQRQIGEYRQVRIALEACHKANAQGRHCYYVLNGEGQEYYRGTWID